MRSSLHSATFVLTLCLAPTAVQAQQTRGFDAHGFQLAAYDGDLRDPLEVQRPGAMTQGDVFLSILADYAKAPLVLVSEAELSGQVVESAVLDNLVTANLAAGVSVHDRLRFDLKAPVYLVSTDPSREQTLGPAPGDLRAAMMLLAVRPRHVEGGGGPGLGVVGYIDAPIGTPDRFLGQSGLAGGVKLAATYELEKLTFSGDIGSQFNPSIDLANLNGSDTLLASLGVGFLASNSVGLTAEIVAQPPFQPPDRLTFPAEALASMKLRDHRSGGYFTLGGAMGLTSGPGVAAFRAFLGGGIARIEPPRAPDHDALGMFQIRDLCPLEAEVKNGWKDDDGCPDKLGALSIDIRYNALPYEADAVITGPDGKQEAHIGASGMQIDALPGTDWTVRATSGNCLEGGAKATADESGTAVRVDLFQKLEARAIVEVIDAKSEPIPTATVSWYGEAACLPDAEMIPVNNAGVLDLYLGMGTHKISVTADGYSLHEREVSFGATEEKRILVQLAPSLVKITKEQIQILEKVHFETARAVIKAESFGLLDEVASTITEHPELGRVEVGGHTDNRGSDSYNLTLSEQRAESVRKYLVNKGGVSADRLIAKGFGEIEPVDTNKTEAGRERNRRVEFKLIDRKPPEGEAPADPPAEGAP